MKPISDCDASDGWIVGHMLMDARASVRRRDRLSAATEFMSRVEMLRDCPFPHLRPLLLACVANKYRRTRHTATLDPRLLTEEEAITIGCGFAGIILSNSRPTMAVEEMLRTYPALSTLASEISYVGPILEVIATRLMSRSVGMKLRVANGLFLSFFDMVSDFTAIVAYHTQGDGATAAALGGTILLGILVQIMIVFFRHAHCSWRRILVETLIVLSLFKSAVEMYRLGNGKEVNGAPFDTHTERSYIKVDLSRRRALKSASSVF